MIIQCEQCQTRFKLDDSKVADKSLKVRCARCKNVFTVAGPQGTPEDVASFLENTPAFQVEEELDNVPEPALEATLSFDAESQAEEDSSEGSNLFDSFSFDADEEQTPPEPPQSADDDSDFSFPSADSTDTSDQVETQKEPDDLDFGAFDFGDDSDAADDSAGADQTMNFDNTSVTKEHTATPAKKEFGGLDFSGDDMFGDVASTTTEDEASESISFDLGMDGFADSMGVESSASSQKTSTATQDLASENPFSLDDIDFGDELTSVAVQQVSTEELKPSQELLFAPLAQTTPLFDIGADTLQKSPVSSAQEELPPLSISSRRKESPRVSGMLVFMGIMIAGLVIFYSYWGFVTLTEDKGKITQETGRITVRSVEATFIKNKKAGDLLVITGEAVNEFGKPRAAIQIKGIVFGANGEEVSSKTAFGGNPLSKEQLSTLTMDKIEAAMANQFGDSLANMEVAPGDAIPFMIVIPKPAADATDYGVEPVGSTVATGKDK
jgi:predicted Zn finger-like uncharacterized protein